MYSIRNTKKLKILLEQEKRAFRTSDLGILWEIKNRSTLHNTISRYVKRELLYRIYKGLYSTIPVDKLHKFELGCALCGPLSYVTTETVLEKEGIIQQEIKNITLFGKKEQHFQVANKEYTCRYLNPKYLVNRAGIISKDRYSIATPERAVLDLKHINPNYYFDNQIAVNKLNTKLIEKKINYAHS